MVGGGEEQYRSVVMKRLSLEAEFFTRLPELGEVELERTCHDLEKAAKGSDVDRIEMLLDEIDEAPGRRRNKPPFRGAR
jgi:hypothetical protein